jgi:serine/threonine protein kinase
MSNGHVPPADALQSLTRIFQSLRINSSTSVSFPAVIQTETSPPTQALTIEERQQLVLSLRALLYSRCFARTFNESKLSEQVSETNVAPDFVRRLSAANHGCDAWLSGWRVQEVYAGGLVVTKGTRRRFAKTGDYAMTFAEEVPPCVGCAVTLRVRKESLALQDGTYCALGTELPLPEDEINVVRLYFNAPHEAAISIVKHTTVYLNEWDVSFTLKIMLRPQDQDRSDATVLYLLKNHYQHFVKLLEKFPASLFSLLKPEVPMLTKRLCDGIGLAESPAGGESFGMHRCRLIAEGVVDAWTKGQQSVEARLDATGRRFMAEGISLALPYLNPGSEDIYNLTPTESSNARSVPRIVEKSIVLTSTNVIAYLKSRGFCDDKSEAVVNWHVAECPSRNWNYAVTRQDGGQGFFVKQLRVQDPESFRMMQREAMIYGLANHEPDFVDLKRIIPPFFNYEDDSKIIILGLVNGPNLMQSQQQMRRFPAEFGRGLGYALAVLHHRVGRGLCTAPSQHLFAREKPGIFTAHRNGPLVRWLGAGQMRLVEQVREHTQLSQGLDDMAASWRPHTFIHGDIKFENSIISAAGPASDLSNPCMFEQLMLVDWELADVGEPCWDIGSVFQAYLSLCLRAAPATYSLSLREHLERSTIAIESMGNAIKAFWQAYCKECNLDEISSAQALLERSMRCASARMVQMALEVMHGQEQPTPMALSLLEVSVDLMTNVRGTIELLGLDDSSTARGQARSGSGANAEVR